MPVDVYAPEDTRQTLGITTTGSDASAVGSGSFALKVRGKLKNLSANYHADAPNTTDTTISYTDHNGVVHNIAIITNNEVDIPLPSMRRDTHDDAAGAISALFDEIDFQQWTTIDVAVAGSDAETDLVVIGLEMERDTRQRFWDGRYNP